ncbi:hypothetical protein [Candidatus Mesenet endosymbiont of Agriotes lineatus]|uniref:hypothetical protein n=1 Tax=Candidatus Mesenet endosymbiont of Agriotes lineatus TaxID=3077948 RepID=UPI0030CBA8F9
MKITLSVLGEQLNNLAESHNDLKALIDQLTKGLGPASTKEIEVGLIKGNEIVNNKHEVKVELNGKSEDSIFTSTGYYFYDNKIYIYDRFKPEISIDLPPQYHFLMVVKTEEDEYKLAFCNKGGNGFHGILDGYKHINPVDIKSTKNIDFAKYYNKNGSYPSFVLKASDNNYPNSQQYGVDVYEIGNGEKKVGSLIDEFGHYDSQNKFHYFNNHLGTQTYDPLSFTITKGDNQCSLHQMKEGTNDVDFTNDAMACSLVEYVANYVNGVYF